MPIADVLDLSELEVVAKIGELDRANLKEGQEVLIRLDAVGEKVFHGKIKSMSGTASANVFSGDPAKKFDVLFSIDMKELLTGLGAKPEQISKILAQADANRNKPPVASAFGGGMGGGAGGEGGGRRMAFFGGPGGPGGGAAGGQGGAPNMSDEDRKKMREAMTKALNGKSMQDLTPEERQKVFEEVRKAVPSLAAAQRGGAGGQGRGGAGTAGAPGAGAAEGGDGRRGGRRSGGEAGMGEGMPRMGGAGGFSARDLENAKLPPPVEPENQLEVLLRPGLLADVEIILEKIPNAINIPTTAVFEKDGKPIVYVRKGNSWEERIVKPLKRTENVTVLAAGVKAGETIAVADPNEKPGDKKKKSDKGGSSNPVGALPGGGRS
jgi:HlyD family secretion protein